MPPTKPKSSPSSPPSSSATGPLSNLVKSSWKLARHLLLDRRYFFHLVGLLLLGETILGLLIIWKIQYTKIDWDAYMQHVELFKGGERDYSRLIGETGPCVYPALFLYIYSTLHTLLPGPTSSPVQIRAAQYVFLALYLVTFALVSVIYYLSGSTVGTGADTTTTSGTETSTNPKSSSNKATARARAPAFGPWSPPQALLIPLTLSKRLHSLYMLRLFNDPFAMVLLYASVVVMMWGNSKSWGWIWGCRLFSLALGVKMNILLFLPGLLVLLVQYRGILGSIRHVLEMVLIQILLPSLFFLSSREHTVAYLTSAFDLSRQFLYKWTVNWRVMTEERFLDRRTAQILLGIHAALLVLFALIRWNPARGTLSVLRDAVARPARAPLSAQELPGYHIPLILFTSNLIGITCARSLHYQFHSWYFHQIPFLLSASGLLGNLTTLPLGVLLWSSIEYAWSTYPSTINSSSALLVSHIVLIVSLVCVNMTKVGRMGKGGLVGLSISVGVAAFIVMRLGSEGGEKSRVILDV